MVSPLRDDECLFLDHFVYDVPGLPIPVFRSSDTEPLSLAEGIEVETLVLPYDTSIWCSNRSR